MDILGKMSYLKNAFIHLGEARLWSEDERDGGSAAAQNRLDSVLFKRL